MAEADRIMQGLQMLRDSGASEAEIDAYMADWGITREDLQNAQDWEDLEQLLAGIAEDRRLAAEGSDTGHILGSANRGVAALAGLPVEAVTGALNAGALGINELAGTDIPYIQDPVGGFESFRGALDEGSRLAMEGTNAIGLTDTNVPDRISEVPAASPTGRVVGSAVEELAAMMGGVGAGGALARGGQRVGDAAQRLATMLIEQPAMQAATSAGAGAGIGLMNEAGGEGLAAELVGAAGGGIGGYGLGKIGGLFKNYLIDPFTTGGRDILAGQTLREFAQQPVNETVEGIQAGMGARETPGVAPITPAVSDDVGMSILARGLQNVPESRMAQNLAERTAENDAAYRDAFGQIGGDIYPEVAGVGLRNTYDQQYGAMRGAVSDAYNAIDPGDTSRIPTGHLRSEIDQVIQQRLARRTEGVPPAVQRVVARFGNTVDAEGRVSPGAMSFADIDEIQRELADLADGYRNAGQGNLAGAVDDIRRVVVRGLEDEIESGMRAGRNAPMEGFTSDQLERYNYARALRQQQGQLYEEGPNAMFGRDRFGSPDVSNSALPDAYLRSAYEGGMQFGQTLGQSPAARQQMADHIVTRGLEGATNQGTGQLRGRSLQRYFQRINPFMRGLRDGGALSEDHYEAIQRATSEMIMDEQAMLQGRAYGSSNVQNLSIAGLIGRATKGVISPDMLGGLTAGAPDRISSLLYRLPQRQIMERLQQSMMDPELAVQLLEKATPGNLQRFGEMFQRRYGVSLGMATLTAEDHPIPGNNGARSTPAPPSQSLASPPAQPPAPRVVPPSPPSPVNRVGGGSFDALGR